VFLAYYSASSSVNNELPETLALMFAIASCACSLMVAVEVPAILALTLAMASWALALMVATVSAAFND